MSCQNQDGSGVTDGLEEFRSLQKHPTTGQRTEAIREPKTGQIPVDNRQIVVDGSQAMGRL